MKFLPFRTNRRSQGVEEAPLLGHEKNQAPLVVEQSRPKVSGSKIFFRLMTLWALYFTFFRGLEYWAYSTMHKKLPSDPHEAAIQIMKKAPVIVRVA